MVANPTTAEERRTWAVFLDTEDALIQADMSEGGNDCPFTIYDIKRLIEHVDTLQAEVKALTEQLEQATGLLPNVCIIPDCREPHYPAYGSWEVHRGDEKS